MVDHFINRLLAGLSTYGHLTLALPVEASPCFWRQWRRYNRSGWDHLLVTLKTCTFSFAVDWQAAKNIVTSGSRAESKVPCTRVRYVSDIGYVSKTQTRYTPSYDSQCKTVPVLLRNKSFRGVKVQTKILWSFFRRFSQVLERCVIRATMACAKNFRAFLWKQLMTS